MKSYRMLFLLTVLLLCAAGCGSQKEIGSVCTAFFDAYAQGDSQALAEMLGMPETEGPFGELKLALAENTSVETDKAKVDGETAVVPAVITTIDIEAALYALPDDTDSVAGARDALLAAFRSGDVPMREFEVEILLEQDGGQWVIRMTPELSDALSGGYYSMLEQMMEEAGL